MGEYYRAELQKEDDCRAPAGENEQQALVMEEQITYASPEFHGQVTGARQGGARATPGKRCTNVTRPNARRSRPRGGRHRVGGRTDS